MIISVLSINFAAIPVHADSANIQSADPISDIHVPNGTAIGSVPLPSTDGVTMDDASTATADVSWDGGSPVYDGNTAGTYAFTGTLTPPGGDTNTNNVTAQVNVIVDAAEASVTTNDATDVSSSDATLNAQNGAVAGGGHSFWVSTSHFDTSSPTIPSGVYSTPDMGAIGAGDTFMATLSSITSDGVPSNLPAITPDTTYYYVAWVQVDGTWIPGEEKTLHTSAVAATPGATTNAATGMTTTGATVNGTNGGVDADNTSFWWGTTSAGPFTPAADPSSEFPSGWNHDLGLGSATAGQAFSEALSALTSGTTYYFAAWSHVAGTWYPGSVEQFMTADSSGPVPSTVVVNDNNLHNWYFYDDKTDTVLTDTADHGFVAGPGTAPEGTGSAHLTKTADDKYGIATAQYAGTPLSSITHLSYSTYRASGDAAQVPSLGFDVDSDTTDGDTSYQGRLTYEPYFTQTVNTGEWQTWNTLDDAAGTGTGNWWFSHDTLSGGAASACTQANPCTWTELLAAYPHAAMRSVGQLILRTNGPDGDAADMNVDNLTIGTASAATNYNFEPVAVPTCSSDDTTFDTFDLGSVNGQHGWQVTNPSFDQAVVANTYDIPSFGCKSLRISDAVTSGSFGDQVFSYSTPNEAGETAAVNNGYSGGTRTNHFDAQFDLASTQLTEQPGMHLSVSPDRGDGARMSYLRFEDQSDGIHVFFDDVTDAGPVGTTADFNESDVATISRTAPHTIKFSMDFVDGPGNDVVKVYIDGNLVATGTSWEDYYRYDPEQTPSGNQVPTVDSLLFRESGTANASDAGKGFLIDNVGATESATPTVTVTIDKYLDGSMATAESANSAAFPMQSSWTAANLGSGSGTYNLDTVHPYSPNAYEAITSPMDVGADYATNEVMDDVTVSSTCSVGGAPYMLQGYSVGDTPEDAASADVTTDAPSFTNLQQNEYVVVHNVTCPVDTEAPSVPVLTSPANGSYENTNDFYFNWENSTDDSAGPLSYDSQFTQDPTEVGGVLQNGIWASTTPTNTIHSQGAPDGTWYWQVRATDPSNNKSDWSSIWSVTLDTQAPAAPSITFPADNAHLSQAAMTDVAWTDESDSGSPVGYIYQSATDSTTNPDGSFTNPAYTSGLLSDTSINTPNTPEGTYYVHVKSVDAAGNESAWSDPITVTVDSTAPTASFVFPTPGPSATSFQVVYSEDVSTADAENADNYFLNNWPGAGGSGPLTGNASVSYDSGSHTATVTFTNPAWYVSAEQQWGVGGVHDLADNDMTPDPTTAYSSAMVAPGAPGTPTTASPTNSTTQDWSWDAAVDPGGADASGVASYQYMVDDSGTWVDNGSATTLETNLDEGTHSLVVRAVDNAGNVGDASEAGSVVVDTTAPVITIDSENPLALHDGDEFTEPSASADDGSEVTVSFDDVDTSHSGTYHVDYEATDDAGNMGTATLTVNVSDADAPVITVPEDITVDSADNTGTEVDYTVTATDNEDGEVTATCSPESGSVFPIGTTEVDCSATDSSDNTGTASFNVTVNFTGSTGGHGGKLGSSGGSAPSGAAGFSGSVLGASAFNFTVDFGEGSTLDPDVTELQKILIADGYLNIPAPTGFYGPMTQAAVKLYQAAHGISTTGYVGPLTRGALNQGTGQSDTGTSIQDQINDLMQQVKDLQDQLASTTH